MGRRLLTATVWAGLSSATAIGTAAQTAGPRRLTSEPPEFTAGYRRVLGRFDADPNRQTNTTPVHGWMQLDGSWVNFDGQTPFIRAALSGDIEVMRLLLAHGRRRKHLDEGTTALTAAAGINWVSGRTYTRI